jgi:F-type H+-transporting ATPase subunit b
MPLAAQMIAAKTRARLAAQAEESRKELEAGLAARLAEADNAIASAKKAAMTNVRSIAEEAAAAIVTRLTGAAPPQAVVAAAIDSTIKD